MGAFIDLSGQRFGKLTVIKRADTATKAVKWVCECDCGNVKIVSAKNLRSGHTQSCGCFQRERTSEASRKDLVGHRFGSLFVIERIGDMGEKTKYRCICDCGNSCVVLGCNLVTEKTQSCGCLRREMRSNLNLIHGMRGTRLYKCWQNMLQRCENANNTEYKNYAARGISVCDEWHDFNVFMSWAESSGYDDSLTIERINVNDGYCPENCTWIPKNEQCKNRTDNVNLCLHGETKILADWSKQTGINASTIQHRLRRGWSIEDAITVKPLERHTTHGDAQGS